MASHGNTTQRPSPNSPSPPTPHADDSKNLSRKNLCAISFSWPFNIPSSPESVAVRIIQNLDNFSLYYIIFVWTVLFIALIPKHKVSALCLAITAEVTFLYFLLLRVISDSVVLHRIIDKRFVLFLLFVITAIELILTQAGVHLFVVLAATLPIVLLHAFLSKREDVFLHEEDGEMARLVEEKLGDVTQSQNLV